MDETCTRLPGGGRIRVRTDSLIGWNVYFFGSYEPGICAFIRSVLAPGVVAVDVGANIGVHSLEMAAAGAKVCAFEPHPRTFRRLEENISLNPDFDIQAHRVALGPEVGDATLFDPPPQNDGMASLNSYEGWAEIPIKMRMLDDIADDVLGSDRVRLVKIDVEGHELGVLQGAQGTLRRHRPIILFEYVDWAWDRAGCTFEDADKLLTNMGYRSPYRFVGRHLRPMQATPTSENLVYFPR